MQFRCSPDQKERWERAAGGAGSLSAWIRDVLDRESEPPDAEARERFEERGEATGYMAGPPLADGDEIEDSSGRVFRVYQVEDVDGAVEEEPVGTNGDEPGPVSGEPDGSSSTVEIEAYPDDDTLHRMYHPRHWSENRGKPESEWVTEHPLSAHPFPTLDDPEDTPPDRLVDTSPAFAELPVPVGLREELEAVPAPIQAQSLDIVVKRLFPGVKTEDLMHEYESTEHEFNDFLGWLTWRHERVEEGRKVVGHVAPEDAPAPDVPPDVRAMLDQAKAEAYDDTPDHFQGNLAANIAGGYVPKTVTVEQHIQNPYPEGFTPTVEFERPDVDLFDDTNPEPEDPVDLEPPRMLEADESAYGGGGRNNVILSVPGAENVTSVERENARSPEQPTSTSPPAASALSPVCVNAAMHWKLVAGETCRYCGGTL
jgi:hypothetical protein